MTNPDDIRERLNQEIAKTKEVIAEYREMTKPVPPENAIGRVSRIDAIQNKSVTEAALRQAEEKLDKLKFALQKVGTPEFGICMRCKGEIPLGRILIRPQSMYCVKCAR